MIADCLSRRCLIDAMAQEIRDCFARYGSGDYCPTEDEKRVIDDILEEVLSAGVRRAGELRE